MTTFGYYRAISHLLKIIVASLSLCSLDVCFHSVNGMILGTFFLKLLFGGKAAWKNLIELNFVRPQH